VFDFANLHLIIAICNDAIARLDINGLNFQWEFDPLQELIWAVVILKDVETQACFGLNAIPHGVIFPDPLEN
jgi:hypothetical protein